MNLLTFNEHFAVVATAEGREAYEKACVAPIFDYTAIKSHVRECVMQITGGEEDFGGDFKLPFPVLRMEIDLRNKPNERLGLRYQLMAFSTSHRIYFRVLDSGYREFKRHLWYFEFGRNPGDFNIYHWNEARRAWQFRVGANITDAELRDGYVQLYQQLVGSVVAFCVDSMSPQLHIASVEPSEPGRSVEWRKARTHYTFITHGHPANKKSVLPGARVGSDANGELVRMAHNRRAHYKTLTHSRYRFKRGQRIFVRATWVGPKEWRDEGGKQIYRILEPSDWHEGDPIFKA